MDVYAKGVPILSCCCLPRHVPPQVICVKLDVTSDASVADAAKATASHCATLKEGLVAVINCAGVGYNGPAEYFPMEMYKKQMDVNFFGYVRVVQALMPQVLFGFGGGGANPLTLTQRVTWLHLTLD
jgi:NAD(P)-dependent dehydrogenase (short-subunit alcohol dehydrogenase family)